MSTITRRKRTSQRELSPYKRHELLVGRIIYPLMPFYTGYGDGRSTDVADYISDEMRADWAEHRDELIEFWQSDLSDAEFFPPGTTKPWIFDVGRGPGALPWAAEQFD